MEKNKKIMFVCSYFPPHTGGLEKYVYNIAKGLKKNKWDIVIITTDKNTKTVKKKVQEKMKIYYLPVWFTISNTPINPFWYFYLKKLIYSEKPDIINAHAPVPFLADIAALTSNDSKFVLTYHDGSMTKEKSLFNIPIFIYEHLLLKLMLARANLIICSSDFIRNGILSNYKSKSVTVNPGVEKVGTPARNKKHNSVMFIASLTNAQRHKGLGELIKALHSIKKGIKDVKLTVVGDGDAVPFYKKLAKEMGVEKNVVFTGPVFGKDLDNIFRQSDVLVLPSTKESFGMVLIEAMAQGTPVIGSNIGGIPGIISDGVDGLLISPNKKEISEAITKILSDAHLASKMGMNGRNKVIKRYLWRYKVEKTNNIFKKLLA